ncbi:MAG: hypothetical protein GY926_16475, partial [bacterium]|nr:hypothetical protein [bacterium]
MNRLLSLQAWLEDERPVGTVLLLDCDMVFRAPVHQRSSPGAPLFQWWYDFQPMGLSGPWATAINDFSTIPSSDIAPITWPCLIHTSDLRSIMPRWIDLTVALREELGAWESDMVAFAAVFAERGVPAERTMLAAWLPWPDDVVGDAPIIHYCQALLDENDDQVWSKYDYAPWGPIGDP